MIADGLSAGDLHLVRVGYRALGDLIERLEPSSAVADLASERAKRRGRE